MLGFSGPRQLMGVVLTCEVPRDSVLDLPNAWIYCRFVGLTVGMVCRELRIRQAYLQHLENLTMEKADEKEALQKKALHQVTSVYKQAEHGAIARLAQGTSKLEVLGSLPLTSCLSLHVSPPAFLLQSAPQIVARMPQE